MQKKVLTVAFLFASWVGWAGPTSGQIQPPAPTSELRVAGDVPTPLVLTAADLKKMPRKALSVVNPHSQKRETYEGVPLEEILRKAGVPLQAGSSTSAAR